MRRYKIADKVFLAVACILSFGLLAGCRHCEPLLMTTFVFTVIYRGLAYSPFADKEDYRRKV